PIAPRMLLRDRLEAVGDGEPAVAELPPLGVLLQGVVALACGLVRLLRAVRSGERRQREDTDGQDQQAGRIHDYSHVNPGGSPGQIFGRTSAWCRSLPREVCASASPGGRLTPSHLSAVLEDERAAATPAAGSSRPDWRPAARRAPRSRPTVRPG